MGCAASRAKEIPRANARAWRPEPEQGDQLADAEKHVNEFRPVIRSPAEGEKAGGTKGAEIRRVFGI